MSADRERRKPTRQQELPRYDQKLRQAKNDDKIVRFALATDTYFTDEDCAVSGHICEVDKYDVLIELGVEHLLGEHVQIWLKKSMIVGTEVL